MIDMNRLRDDQSTTQALILKKEPNFPVAKLLELDKQVRTLRSEVEDLRQQKNELAKQGAKGLSDDLRAQAIELGKKLKAQEQGLETTEKEFKDFILRCPNVPLADVPEGNKEANQVIKTVGKKPDFSFGIKNHLQLNEKLNWFDLDTAGKLAGSGFVLYKEFGTKLTYALTQLMLRNNVKHGFVPTMPPLLATEQTLYNAGNLPKFAGDYYQIEKEKLCLIPTAEVSLTNMHANEILAEDQLPLRYTAWTSCFRREAGGYGATERGLIRIHQFEKVELFSICTPEESSNELERMVACAEDLLAQLGLHYQVSLLAAQDCSFQSAKTYDIEVWLPGQDQYYEVSSCSNCIDFQARRAKIRYKGPEDKKPKLAHTLNGSSLALPRLIVALMETYQQTDGSIILPKALQKIMKELW